MTSIYPPALTLGGGCCKRECAGVRFKPNRSKCRTIARMQQDTTEERPKGRNGCLVLSAMKIEMRGSHRKHKINHQNNR